MREKLRKFDGSGEPIFRFNLNAINKEGMMRTCMTCRENRQNKTEVTSTERKQIGGADVQIESARNGRRGSRT